MSFAAAQIAIESRFATNFTACPVNYPNVPYDPVAGTTFCKIEVIQSWSQRADIGTNNPLHRNFGIINVNIYLPIGTGTNTGQTLADMAAAVFRDQSFSGITCRSPLVRNVGEVEGWYLVNMTCPFYHDDVYP